MARKRAKQGTVEQFRAELDILDKEVTQDVRLPSLGQSPPRLQGFGFKFTLVLPLLSATGQEVFTGEHLLLIHSLLCRRFGGCSALSSTSHPPLYGFYQPAEKDIPEKDYHTQFVVYSAPLDGSNIFFARLKAILRTAPLQPQEEILVERSDVMLI